MKKMIWALIFGAIAVLPAHAEDLAIPAASGNDAADSAKIEQYMEQAVDKQLAAHAFLFTDESQRRASSGKTSKKTKTASATSIRSTLTQ